MTAKAFTLRNTYRPTQAIPLDVTFIPQPGTDVVCVIRRWPSFRQVQFAPTAVARESWREYKSQLGFTPMRQPTYAGVAQVNGRLVPYGPVR
jgi:hypothetical protein